MIEVALSAVRWLFSEVLVIAVILLAMSWMTGVLSI
jgi:hypothetical protein